MARITLFQWRLAGLMLVAGSSTAGASGQLQAAHVESATGTARWTHANGNFVTQITKGAHPWICHGDKLQVKSGSLALRYTDGSAATLSAGPPHPIYRRYSSDESALQARFKGSFRVAVRSMGSGNGLLFPGDVSVPSTLVVFEFAAFSSKARDLVLRHLGQTIFHAITSGNRFSSSELRSSLKTARSEDSELVDFSISVGGEKQEGSFRLMSSAKEVALLEDLQKAERIKQSSLRHLARAETFKRYWQYPYALSELNLALKEGPPYPFALKAKSELLADKVLAVAPPER